MKKHATVAVEVLSTLRKPVLRGAEIGVWEGVLSRDLLTAFSELTLQMVDLWAPFASDSQFYLTSHQGKSDAAKFKKVKQSAESNVRRFGSRAKMMQQSSLSASRVVEGGLDFVFLDADHVYQAVVDDLAAWYPLLRSGGVFLGHDYGAQRRKWGVKRAADKFTERMNLQVQVHLGAKVFWIFKPSS